MFPSNLTHGEVFRIHGGQLPDAWRDRIDAMLDEQTSAKELQDEIDRLNAQLVECETQIDDLQERIKDAQNKAEDAKGEDAEGLRDVIGDILFLAQKGLKRGELTKEQRIEILREIERKCAEVQS